MNSRGMLAARSAPHGSAATRDRTKDFAKQVVRLCRTLPKEWDVRELGRQLLRSATAVAANYRACGRARSDKEFCSKLGVVVEEADESQLWVELVKEAHPALDAGTYRAILGEATELTAIFTASHRTARTNLKRKIDARKKNKGRAD